MSDEDFVKVSLPYFDKQIWTLHVGLCLYEKNNPNPKMSKTDQNDSSHHTISERTFKMAMKAIGAYQNKTRDYEPLPILPNTTSLNNAEDIKIDPRDFIKWVQKKWPNDCSHLEEAEANYKKNKEIKKQQKLQGNKQYMNKYGHNNEENCEKAKQVFFNMVKVNNINLDKHTMIGLAEDLRTKLSEIYENPYSVSHLRLKLIPVWRLEYLDNHKESQ